VKELLEKKYKQYRYLIPECLLYSKTYFDVKSILQASDIDMSKVAAERLRHTMLNAVQNVPFYRRLNVDIKSVLNENPYLMINEFPYIEKDQIMDSPSCFFNKNGSKLFAKYATSGGSTGKGIGIWRTKSSVDIEALFFNNRWGRYGFSLQRSKVLRIGADARRKLDESPMLVSGNRLMLSPYHVNNEYIDEIVVNLCSFDFEFIHAYPSCVLELTRLLKECGVDNDFGVRAILLASEPITIEQLEFLNGYWKCPISVNYGLSERTNIGFYEYSHGDDEIKYELERLYSFSENLDNEIVGTSFWNDLMPLIRYRTSDIGRVSDDSISHLCGRSQEYLIDRHGSKVPGTSVVIDEFTWDYARQYQVKQENVGEIEILLVPRSGLISEEVVAQILDYQKARWGEFFDIGIKVVNDIPLTSSGKSKLVDVNL